MLTDFRVGMEFQVTQTKEGKIISYVFQEPNAKSKVVVID